MNTFDFDQFEEIAEKLNKIQKNISAQGDDYLKFERASEKLQTALYHFKQAPFDSAKSRSLLNALATYKTACEIFIVKTKNISRKAHQGKIDLNTLPLTNEIAGVFSDYHH